ncbi:MAG TPA: hypothetical protein VFU01_05390 [Gemmatimonadaceae bacterium]|nr:hypothetical protein [Gemmatimonadaceae bacterium]
MFARPFRTAALAAAASLTLAGCASAPASGSFDYAATSRPTLSASTRTFNAEAIRRTGALTAWDAVRTLVPPHRLYSSIDDASSRSLAAARNGRNDGVRFVLDGQPLLDSEPLRSIPAGDVLSLRILSASEAAMLLAGGSASGAILVETRYTLGRR